MSKHTPGPWNVSSTFGSIGAIQYKGGFVAFPCAPRNADETRDDGESWIDMRDRTQSERDLIAAEQAANARLIAAAPDLLEALKNVTAHLVAAHSLLQRGGKKAAASDKIFNIMLADYEKAADVGRNAIVKATGND